jgi:hypothetical protein
MNKMLFISVILSKKLEKKQKCHKVGTIPNSNYKIVERGTNDSLITQIQHGSFT